MREISETNPKLEDYIISKSRGKNLKPIVTRKANDSKFKIPRTRRPNGGISLIVEKTNSKKPLSSITSFQLLIFQRGIKVFCSCFTVWGFSPFFTIDLPWRILLHSSTPLVYSSSGISIEIESPFIQGWRKSGNVKYVLLLTTWVKDNLYCAVKFLAATLTIVSTPPTILIVLRTKLAPDFSTCTTSPI